LRRIDGRDIVTEYEYDDPGGLLTAITYTGHSSQDVAFTYDDLGREQKGSGTKGVRTLFRDDAGS